MDHSVSWLKEFAGTGKPWKLPLERVARVREGAFL
jgi:hypothetical protein